MIKRRIGWVLLSAAIMVLLPLLAVTFVRGDAGMAVSFLLFFAVNPIYSVLLGVFSGKRIRDMWSLPAISAILFLLGTWIFFEMLEPAFWLYAAAYLVLGTASMLVSARIAKRKTHA